MDTALLITAASLTPYVGRWRDESLLPADPPLRLSEAIPPHVTLASPWEGDAMEKVQHVDAFELQFATVGTFVPGTVFLAPDPSPGLETLARAIGLGEDWVPHLTVSRRGGDEVAARVRAELEPHWPLKLLVDEVSAWSQLATGHWVRDATAPLR